MPERKKIARDKAEGAAGRRSTQLLGAAGEAVAQAHLLRRGYVAANVNNSVRNNTSYDLLVERCGHKWTVAVKALSGSKGSVTWGLPCKASEATTLLRGGTVPDFVAFVWFTGRADAPMEHRVFVVPGEVVDRAALAAARHWLKSPKRDGGAHQDRKAIGIGFKGGDTLTNIAAGFESKWAEYEDAWAQLESGPAADVGSQAERLAARSRTIRSTAEAVLLQRSRSKLGG